MAKLTVKEVPQEEMAQMHVNLIVFLQEGGYEYANTGSHFVVSIPQIRIQPSDEKPDKKK